MTIRARLYADGLLTRYTLPCRVISIGNLTVGGTGKTPVVIALASALRDRGCRVGVVSRGYKRSSTGEIVEVSDGTVILGDPSDTGDEPWLIAQRCPGVVVAVGANRPVVGRSLIRRHQVDTVIMDDGYQHLALRRETNILILDASAPFGNGCLLPCGRLRESLSAMARATAVLVTRASQASNLDDLKATVRTVAPSVPIWVTDFAPSTVAQVGGTSTVDSSVLHGERVFAISGIGHPASFQTMLESAGATVVEQRVFPDHHAYSKEDVHRVRQAAERVGATRIVTTEKDAVKLSGLVEGEGRVRGDFWAIRIELQWLEGYTEWERMVAQRNGCGA